MGANQSYEAVYTDALGGYQDGGKGTLEDGNRKKKKAKPTPPPRPVITGATHNSISLSWQPPRSSNQHAVIAYTVEMRLTNLNTSTNHQHTNYTSHKAWQTVTKNCQGTHYDVRHLSPDTEYIFRVRAENIFGTGKPSTPSDPVTTRLFESSCDDYSFGSNHPSSFIYNTTTANALFPLTTNSIASDAILNTATFISPMNPVSNDSTNTKDKTLNTSKHYDIGEENSKNNLCTSFLTPAPTPLSMGGNSSTTSSSSNIIFDFGNILEENESHTEFSTTYMVKSPTFPVDSSTLLSSPSSSFETLSPSTPTSPNNTSRRPQHHYYNRHSQQISPSQQQTPSCNNVKRRHSFNVHLNGNVSSILNNSGRFNSTRSLTSSNSNSTLIGNLSGDSSRRFRNGSMRHNISLDENSKDLTMSRSSRLRAGSASSVLVRNDANRASLQLQPTYRKASIPIILPGTGSSSINKLRESRAASSRSHSFLLSPSRSSELSRETDGGSLHKNRKRNVAANGANFSNTLSNEHNTHHENHTTNVKENGHQHANDEYRYSVGSTASDITNTTASSTTSASSKDGSSSGCYSGNSNRLSTQSELSDVTISTHSQASEDNATNYSNSNSSRPVSCNSYCFSDVDNGDGSCIIGYNDTVDSVGAPVNRYCGNIYTDTALKDNQLLDYSFSTNGKVTDDCSDLQTPTLFRKENGFNDDRKGNDSPNFHDSKLLNGSEFVPNSKNDYIDNMHCSEQLKSNSDADISTLKEDMDNLKMNNDVISKRLTGTIYEEDIDALKLMNTFNDRKLYPKNNNNLKEQHSHTPNQNDCYYQTLENPWQLDTDSVNGVSENVMAAPFTDDVKIAFHAERNRKLFSNTTSNDVIEDTDISSPNQMWGNIKNNNAINNGIVMENGGDFRTLLSVLQSNQVLVKQSRSLPEVVGVVLGEGGEPRRALTRGTLTTIEDDEEEEAVRVTTL